MKKNKEALKGNKLLSGLLDVYLKVAKAKSEADYKGIYEEYQELQRQIPFNIENMQNYVDLGCRIMRLSDEQSENVYFAYPLTLYTAYVAEGGKSDDYRGGYLFPVQVLNEEELAELQKISPEMFEKNSEKTNKNEKSEDYSK